MSTTPLISVIVPVYNVEGYLRQCLDSIVEQTYPYLEIILVDDGSTDSSGGICDEYAQRDTRIRVIHKANGGLSSARNAGMDVMTGEFVSFVDSDDWLETDLYSDFVCHLSTYPDCDVFEFSMTEHYPTKTQVMKHSDDCILRGEQVLEAFVQQSTVWMYAWDKVWKASIVQPFRFPVGKLNEDTIFTYEVLFYSPEMTLVYRDKPYYNYRKMREGAITYRFSSRAVLDQLEGTRRLTEQIKVDAPHASSFACRYMASYMKETMIELWNGGVEEKSMIDAFIPHVKWLSAGANSRALFDRKTRFFLRFPMLYLFLQQKIGLLRCLR